MNHFDQERIAEPCHLDSIGNLEVIKQWATEIKDALKTKADLDEWLLVGRAVTLICDDSERARAIVSEVAKDAGFSFRTFTTSELMAESNKKFHSVVPSIIYLEPGEWMRTDANQNNYPDESIVKIQSYIKHTIQVFDCRNPVIFVTSIKDYSEFDVGFKQQGLFDRRFLIPAPSYETIGVEFLALIGIDQCNLSLTKEHNKVGFVVRSEFNDSRRQAIAALAMRRIAFRERRLLEFTDFMQIMMHGTMESDINHDALRVDTNTVVHEAGHAAIAIIDSNGENIPDYVSIIPSNNAGGITAESYAFIMSHEDQLTYQYMRHKVRICLAGRAAEHIIFGSQLVSVYGAETDMNDANLICLKMFGNCGISPKMEEEGESGSNMIVSSNERSPIDEARVNKQIQFYLNKQYNIVVSQLSDNRPLLDKIIEQLNERHVLLQSDLNDIHKNVIVKYSDAE